MKISIMPTSPTLKGIFRQYMATFAVSISFLTIGQSVAWPSPTLPKILAYETPIHLDIGQISWMVSLMFFGTMISPIPAGYFMDKVGRKKTLVFMNALQFTSWSLILFGRSVPLLYVARLFSGLYNGLVATIEPIYIGEIAQPDIRGRLSSFNNFMMSIGMLFTFIVGPYISYDALALISLMLPVIFFLTFTFMPESPYYLIMKEKRESARESLSWLRGDKNKIELEMELNTIEKNVLEQSDNRGSYMDVLGTKASRKALIISETYAALKKLSGSGIIQTFASTTLPQSTFNLLDPSHCVIILGIVGVVASFYTIILSDKYNRRTLLVTSCLGCGVTTLVSGIWFYLDSKTDVRTDIVNFIPFVMFAVHTVMYSIGLGPVGATFKGELFPANLKSKMSALSTIMLAITSFILNKFYLIIAYEEGMYLNYFIFSFFCLLGVVFTIVYLPETRGKTLQEIQDLLNGVERQKITTPVLSRIV